MLFLKSLHWKYLFICMIFPSRINLKYYFYLLFILYLITTLKFLNILILLFVSAETCLYWLVKDFRLMFFWNSSVWSLLDPTWTHVPPEGSCFYKFWTCQAIFQLWIFLDHACMQLHITNLFEVKFVFSNS